MPQAKNLRKVRARKGSMPDNVRAGKDGAFCFLQKVKFFLDRKCHRKHTAAQAVRVKRRGKSSPHFQQWKWHGKPHREQGQTAMGCPSHAALWRLKSRVDRLSTSVTVCRERWQPCDWCDERFSHTEPGLQARLFLIYSFCNVQCIFPQDWHAPIQEPPKDSRYCIRANRQHIDGAFFYFKEWQCKRCHVA